VVDDERPCVEFTHRLSEWLKIRGIAAENGQAAATIYDEAQVDFDVSHRHWHADMTRLGIRRRDPQTNEPISCRIVAVGADAIRVRETRNAVRGRWGCLKPSISIVSLRLGVKLLNVETRLPFPSSLNESCHFTPAAISRAGKPKHKPLP